MNISHKGLLVLLTMVCYSSSIGNPGVLLSVPFPLNIPQVPLGLPLAMENIVISNLELTNVYVRQLDYSWKFNAKNAEVKISLSQITFDWFYKKDKGYGTFRQEGLDIEVYYSFVASHSNHFEINVTSSKIKAGHSKVSLGGGASQIVIVEVTNLILNHASLLFRGFISKQLSKAVNEFSSIIGEDLKVYTDSQTGKDFYVNMSLVAQPSLVGDNLLVQINGAPYLHGTTSGSLNPEDILVKTTSDKIQVQIHKKVVSSFIALFLKEKGGQLAVTMHTLGISSTIDVNSAYMGDVFPQMNKFPDDRDVIFDLKVPSINFTFNEDRLRFAADLYTNVVTHNTIEKRDELYIDRIDGQVSVQIMPIYGSKKCSLRIIDIEVLKFIPQQEDVTSGRFRPDGISRYFGFLTEWLGDAINLELNRKVLTFSFKNILAVLKGKTIKDAAYYLQIDIKQL